MISFFFRMTEFMQIKTVGCVDETDIFEQKQKEKKIVELKTIVIDSHEAKATQFENSDTVPP